MLLSSHLFSGKSLTCILMPRQEITHIDLNAIAGCGVHFIAQSSFSRTHRTFVRPCTSCSFKAVSHACIVTFVRSSSAYFCGRAFVRLDDLAGCGVHAQDVRRSLTRTSLLMQCMHGVCEKVTHTYCAATAVHVWCVEETLTCTPALLSGCGVHESDSSSQGGCSTSGQTLRSGKTTQLYSQQGRIDPGSVVTVWRPAVLPLSVRK